MDKSSTEIRWNAEGYHQNSSIQLEASKKVLGGVLFSGNERVLDIGCGDGKITAMISTYVPKGRVLGVDLSPEMILFANKEFAPPEYKNLLFQLLDGTKIKFEGEFDIVFLLSRCIG